MGSSRWYLPASDYSGNRMNSPATVLTYKDVGNYPCFTCPGVALHLSHFVI